MIYISDRLEYKLRKDLEIYEKKKVESTFVEIINSKGKNVIIGCIYKHHNISDKEFNMLLEAKLAKVSQEKKPC